MCGIVGYTEGFGRADEAMLRRLTALIAHRGPDDEGFYRDRRVSLGMRRLSIIDPAGGHQPMITPDGRFVLIYNGEIYNFRELKEKLSGRGVRFTTSSDTEVLLFWLAEFGTGGLAELNGMFAFACWDCREQSLLLARDRLGIKPLYYTRTGGELAFASEIKALLPLLGRPEPEPNAIFEYLTFQNIVGEKTFFRNVHKLLPGRWLRWSPAGVSQGAFWELSFPRDWRGGFDQAREEYSQTLREAVERHLIADVPVGSYLSGGFDSGTVATVAAGLLPGKMSTFTGAFTDSSYYDERSGSRAVAAGIGAEPFEVVITPTDYRDQIGRVIYHLDEPTLGSGALPQFMVSRLVSRRVKVVLTGHGGDELFAGYPLFKVAQLRETLQSDPAGLGRFFLSLEKSEWARVLYYSLWPLVFPEIGYGVAIMIPRRRRSGLLSRDFLALNDGFEPLESIRGMFSGTDYSAGEKLMAWYLKTYLPTLLIQEDKVGMAHSIEARTPLCDNRMLELALRLPLGVKLHCGRLKSLPREAMRGRLPEILYQLPKRGFPTPFARWYRREPVREMLEETLFGERARQRGVFDCAALEKSFRRNLASATDNLFDFDRARLLHSASLIELWFRTFIDPVEPGPVA